ncbi:MAG: DUF111 family protein [Lachnospiraceae bacterium]|nr:DUF111 family protein [Lachnospiraceae bacterium]
MSKGIKQVYAALELCESEIRILVGEYFNTRFNIIRADKYPTNTISDFKVSDKEKLVEAMFRHTTTIGIRECALDRYILSREIETTKTPYGEVRRKTSAGYGAKREKIEFEDLARIARERGISLWEARELL